MKIKEYIEFKRQYFPPKVKVHKILDEGILAGTEATGSNMGSGDNEGGNLPAKQAGSLEFDDFEE